jgi:serine/threonine protein kinase
MSHIIVAINMILTAGTKLGTYEILGPLGAGGMGEVYRARDSKLKREVAIKLLPDAFSSDPERLARFQREAEVLASLNHPNIAAIYDVAEFGESRFLVLELVEGETLAERIVHGPIPIDMALNLTRAIAEALEAAHEKGIIHRDLKPANIKITPDGKVKVLDFGLAKVRETDDHVPNLSNSPTIMTAASVPGTIMGTVGYMSPEQAAGKRVDKRTDVWALGCVLFEMLAGRRAFSGDTTAEVLAAILRGEPDFAMLPLDTRQPVSRMIRVCLRKDANERPRDLRDLFIHLGEPEITESLHQRNRAPRAVAVTALVVILAITGSFLISSRRVPGERPPVVFTINEPVEIRGQGTRRSSVAVSPDGEKIVFVHDGQLYLRSITQLEATPLTPRDANTSGPFFSPDGRWVGFFNPLGSWSPDDKIFAFSVLSAQGARRIWTADVESNAPGRPWLNTNFSESQPAFSPNGKLIAYMSAESGRFEIYIRSFPDVGNKKQVSTEGGADPIWTPDGTEILYRQGNSLFSVRLENLDAIRMGKPRLLFEKAYLWGVVGARSHDIMPDGRTLALIARSQEESAVTQLNVILNWDEKLKQRFTSGQR